MKRITAITIYKSFEDGFWGLEAEEKYLPVNFPEQFKTEGIKVDCVIALLKDVDTIFNWGQPCRIISFKTPQVI